MFIYECVGVYVFVYMCPYVKCVICFPQILAELEDLSKNLPKFKRSQSEPNLHSFSIPAEDHNVPHTPVHAMGSKRASNLFHYPQMN